MTTVETPNLVGQDQKPVSEMTQAAVHPEFAFRRTRDPGPPESVKQIRGGNGEAERFTRFRTAGPGCRNSQSRNREYGLGNHPYNQLRNRALQRSLAAFTTGASVHHFRSLS